MRPNLLTWALALCLGFSGFVSANATDLTAAEIARLTPAQKKVLEKAAEREEKYRELVDAKELQSALPLLEKILTAYESVLGKEHPLTAEWTSELGLMHFELGNYRESKPYFERALAAQRKKLGPEHEETVSTLHNLGNLQLTTSDNAAARQSFEEVLRIHLKTHGEKHDDTCAVLNDLGLWADKTGDWVAAKDYFQRSLKISRELHGDDLGEIVITLGNLGLAEWSAGEYLQARDHQEEALAIRRKTLGDKHSDTALSLNNLALVERDLGDLASARKHAEEAVEITKESLGEKHANYALFLANLSTILVAQNDLDAALPLAEQALAVQEEAYGKNHDETVIPLVTLAMLKLRAKDFAAAAEFLDRAKEAAEQSLGADSLPATGVLSSQAGLYWLQGRPAEAVALHRQVYKFYREKYGAEHIDVSFVQGELAVALAAAGNFPAALTETDAARRIVRMTAVELLPGLPDRQLLKCLEENDKEYLHAALSLGMQQQADPAWREKSAAWLVNGKASAQEALAQQALLARESRDPEIAPAVNELLSVRRRLAALSVVTPGKDDAADHQTEIEQLETQEQTLQKQIAAHQRKSTKLPEAAAKVSHWTELADLRKKLPADAVFVNFARLKPVNLKPTSFDDRFGEDRYAAWVIPAAGELQIVDLGPAAEIDERIKSLRDAITASVAGGAVAKQGEVAAAEKTALPLRELAEKVFHPLLPLLGDKTTTLILSPDSRLWLAPWQALPLADGNFAIEKYRFRFLLSGRELTAAVDPPSAKAALIFADPNYNLTPAAAEDSLKAIYRDKYQPPATDGPKLRSLEAAEGKLQAARLPGTAAEARAIQPALEKLTKSKAFVYTDQYALEGVFKKINRPGIVVLSTHGFFQEDQSAASPGGKWAGDGAAHTAAGKPLENPLLRCGLLLAGCNQPRNDGGDDGVLTGLEILAADLRGTELVVLSACETGLGKVNDGDGVAGLRQAFQLAGAKSVVASLWQVPDHDSALLMNDFFTELAAGKAQDEALRNAQIKRIASRRDRFGAAHPFFWAAWTVTGE